MSAPDPQPGPGRPGINGAGAWLRIKLVLNGALLGASIVLFLVLMQWHAPGRLGWSMPWLPSKPAEPADVAVLSAVAVLAPAKTAQLEIPATLAPGAKQPMPAPMPAPVPPAPAPSVAAQPGALLIPVAGIAAGQLTDTFSDARGSGRVHDAMDIMAPKGTPVFAVADGRLVKLFNSKQGGLTIYQFNAAETTAYYYAHLERYAEGMAEGRALRRGETIGYVGSTGNASPEGPHLHFAVFTLGPEKKWWQGTAINPYPLLTGMP